jgi:hypothetical protein
MGGWVFLVLLRRQSTSAPVFFWGLFAVGFGAALLVLVVLKSRLLSAHEVFAVAKIVTAGMLWASLLAIFSNGRLFLDFNDWRKAGAQQPDAGDQSETLPTGADDVIVDDLTPRQPDPAALTKTAIGSPGIAFPGCGGLDAAQPESFTS